MYRCELGIHRIGLGLDGETQQEGRLSDSLACLRWGRQSGAGRSAPAESLLTSNFGKIAEYTDGFGWPGGDFPVME